MDAEKLAKLENEDQYPEPIRAEWKLLARVRIWNPEIPLRDVAQRVGYSYQAVRNWLRNPAYQRYENYLLGKEYKNIIPEAGDKSKIVRETFTEYAVDMQQRLLDILEVTSDDKFAASIAQDWLDRAGHGSIRKEQKLGVTVVLTADALADMRNRALEAGLD